MTVAHTCGGTNRLLVVGCQTNSGADSITGVTYAGVSLTRIDAFNIGGGPWYLYYLVNPSSGTNNIVVSADRSSNILTLQAVSYTGCLQTASVINAQPAAGNNNSTTSISQSITSTVDNCWMVLYSGVGAAGGGISAGTNTTERVDNNYGWIGDSNGPVTPAGSLTLNASYGSNTNWNWKGIAIAPTAQVSNSFMLLGIG